MINVSFVVRKRELLLLIFFSVLAVCRSDLVFSVAASAKLL